MEQEILENISLPSEFGIVSTSTEAISADELGEVILGGGAPAVTSNPDDVSSIDDKGKKQETPTKVIQEPPAISEDEIADSILGDDTSTDNDVDTTEGTKTQPIDNDNDEDNSDYNPIEVIAKDLFKIGIFNKQDDEEDVEIKTPEELKDRFLAEAKLQASNQIYNFLMEKHGEEGFDMFQSIFVNGVSPKEYLSKYNEIESVSDLDLSDESNQEKVYRAYYKSLEWEDQDIEDSLRRVKEYGDLEAESQKVQKKLVVKQQKELAQIEQQKIQQAENAKRAKAEYSKAINDILVDRLKKKDFDGIPLTEKVARETWTELTQDRYQLPNGEKLTEIDKFFLDLKRPENIETKLKIWLLHKTGFDFSKIKQKAVSDKNEELFHNLTIKEKQQKRINKSQNFNNDFTSFLK